MKKQITLVLTAESDEVMLRDSFIENDLMQEINCASNSYELVSIETHEVVTTEPPEIIHCKDCKKHHLGFGFCPMVHHSAENPLMVYELNDDDDFCSRAEKRLR